MPRSPVTIRDIAKHAEVSPSAVSLALRNSPKISAAQRERIQQLAQELGYTKDPHVTQLMAHLRQSRATRSAATLAVLIPEIGTAEQQSYHPIRALLEGIRDQAGRMGFELDVFHLADMQMSSARLRNILIARGIKGIIVLPFRSGVGRIDFDFSGFCAATAGFSIIDPMLDRACPNYLQMMDELLEHLCAQGYERIGLVMTYGEGGIGQKLFTSSFLFFQTKIAAAHHIPILPKKEISDESLQAWIEQYRPQAIVGAGSVYQRLARLGYRIPADVAFASIDLSEPPVEATGVNHRYRLIGRETVSLVATNLNLNQTGVPENPRVVLVDSHRRDGFSLPPCGSAIPVRLRTTVSEKMARQQEIAAPVSPA
ncbi:MAG: LacI family DNA-binding transcriptional regulator [Verrucomicrobiota bacterium JB022]|nr:LacI family DNA-binding transcriptional regulator [Verrucomicrobiota bacterium JB022]